jgi:hypothetical protein
MYKNCLIAGPTSGGKSLLSRRLVEIHGFSRIPGDALVLAFQKRFPELGIGHAVDGMSVEDAYASTCRGFGRFLVEFLNALAWENPMPYVVDTFHARPADLTEIDTRKTQILFLGYPDADPNKKAIQTQKYQKEAYGTLHGWVASELAAVAAKFRIFIQMSRELREECAACGLAFIDTSSGFNDALSMAANLATSEEKAYDR